jgi:hypothetical protein
MYNRLFCISCLIFISVWLHGQSHVPIFHGDLKCHLGPNGALNNPTSLGWIELEDDGDWHPLMYNTGWWLLEFNSDSVVTENRFAELAYGGIPGPNELPWGYEHYEKVWSVTAADIGAHLVDLADNGQIDNPIPSIFGWPGRGNPHFLEYSGGIIPLLLGEMAPFFDSDGDGIYDPAVGDYPVLQLDDCQNPIIPSQMHWCMYRIDWSGKLDVTPLEVQVCLFSLGCEEDDHPLNKTLFIQHVLLEKYESPSAGHDNLLVGWHFAPLFGLNSNQYIGTFPQRNTAFVYSADNDDWDFGENPPSFAFDLLSWPKALDAHPEPLKGIRHFFGNGVGTPPPPPTFPPATIHELKNNMQGLWLNGEPMTVGGIGYGGTEPTNFSFPGLPEQPGGWTEWEAQNNPIWDRRVLFYLSPFDIEPNSRNEFLMAFTYSDTESGHLAEVTHLRDQLDAVQGYFDNCFQLQTTPGFPGCSLLPSEVSSPKAGNPTWSLSPNPAQTYVQVEIPGEPGGTLTLLDVTGQVVRHIPVKETVETIDTSDLPGGLYLIRWVDKQQRVSVKRLVIH